MSILKSLLAEFAPVTTVERPSETAHVAESLRDSNSTSCPHCHCIDHWQPHGSIDWYCIACDPPPSESMIARRRGAPKITSSCSYAVGRYQQRHASVGGNRITFTDFCTRTICTCGSHMITEHTWSDGAVTYECACNGPACNLLPTAQSPTA